MSPRTSRAKRTRQLVRIAVLAAAASMAALPLQAQTAGPAQGPAASGTSRAAAPWTVAQAQSTPAAPVADAGARPSQIGADAVVVMGDNQNPIATGLVVGFKTAAGSDRAISRAVLVPAAALMGMVREQVKVRDRDGRVHGVDFKRIDFQRQLSDAQAISALARAGEISPALAREHLEEAASQPQVAVLFLEESRTAEGLRPIEVLDETCPEEGDVRYVLADGSGRAADRSSRQLTSEPTAVGALSIVTCQGQTFVRGIVSSIGARIETIDLSKVAKALKPWLKLNESGADLAMHLATPRYVAQCPARAQRRSSARVARRLQNSDTGALELEVVDYPPDIDDRISLVTRRSEKPLVENEFPWSWGNRGSSNEFVVLRVLRGNESQFVFERFCKDNLASRGRIVGSVQLDQGTSLSEDIGVEGENARFAVRLNNRVTLVSTPTLRHGLVVDSFPEADRLTRAGRLYFAEAANGGDLLIGHSRSRRIIFVARLPSGEAQTEGGRREEVDGRPALRMTTPRALGWQDNAFDLRQLGWRETPPQRTPGATPTPSEPGAVQIEVVGRSIAILGDAGMAVLSLDDADRPRVLVNISRADQAAPAGQAMSPLLRQFAGGDFRLIASTVAQAPGSENFAVVALYSERGRSQTDFVAILPVVAGAAGKLRLVDLKTTLRSRIDAAGRSLDLSEERLYNPQPASGVMALGTTPTLERFWGALVVNAAAQAGRPGRQARDIDFAFGFNLHFWLNRFDRIWDFEALSGREAEISLCERFDFGRLNVITIDSLPHRVIAAVDAGCGLPAGSGTPRPGSEVRTLAIRDFLYQRFLAPRRP